MTRSSTWTLAYGGLAAVDTALSGSSRTSAHRLRYLTKPLLMPSLAASGLVRRPGQRSRMGTATLVAQAFSWGGDVALLGEGTRVFAAGTGSFGLAHLAYVWGLRSRADSSRSLLARPGTKALLGMWLVSTPVMARGAARTDPVLALAVSGYASLLTAMAANALRLDATMPVAARRLIAAGALLFLASDTMLGLRKFVLTDPPPALESLVMATYTGAQLLFSEGAARAS
ncbi:MAG: lysoplasmalogenase [Actinomycetota bacterium]|nr:lysoplasmalogenase [Actinomycetota bacterium]